jgi:hypothetical protein
MSRNIRYSKVVLPDTLQLVLLPFMAIFDVTISESFGASADKITEWLKCIVNATINHRSNYKAQDLNIKLLMIRQNGPRNHINLLQGVSL